MNKDRDYYNKILGLQPGATKAEIKTAYRKLVKLYHPDRDQSPDAQMMYREIRSAYDILLNSDSRIGTEAETAANQSYSRHASQTSSFRSRKTQYPYTSYVDSSGQTTFTREEWDNWEKRANWTSSDWEYSDTIPFEMKNLFSIFFRSLNELLKDYSFIFKGLFSLCFALASVFDKALVFRNMVIMFHIVAWISIIIFRYYYVHYTNLPWTFSNGCYCGIFVCDSTDSSASMFLFMDGWSCRGARFFCDVFCRLYI